MKHFVAFALTGLLSSAFFDSFAAFGFTAEGTGTEVKSPELDLDPCTQATRMAGLAQINRQLDPSPSGSEVYRLARRIKRMICRRGEPPASGIWVYPNGKVASYGGTVWYYSNGAIAGTVSSFWYYPSHARAGLDGSFWYYPNGTTAGLLGASWYDRDGKPAGVFNYGDPVEIMLELTDSDPD